MSIVAVHGPQTFGSKGVMQVGAAMATPNSANGLQWVFKLDQPSTRTTSLAWTFPTGTPASVTGPGPHSVTFGSAGNKAVTAVATGTGEGANPYPPAGTTNISVTAVAGASPQMLMAPGGGGEEGEVELLAEEEVEEEEEFFDPADYTIEDVLAYVNENPDQAQEVLDAELEGKNRVTLVSQLEGLAYDPSGYTITQVIGFVEEHPDRLEDIIALEQSGKNRTTLINQLEEMREA